MRGMRLSRSGPQTITPEATRILRQDGAHDMTDRNSATVATLFLRANLLPILALTGKIGMLQHPHFH